MAMIASVDELRLLLNVTQRVSELIHSTIRLPLHVTAYNYSGKVFPHWATFQHYLPGSQHIMHPDTDKGEHCVSFALSFSSHGKDFGGGEVKVFECPPSVSDCGNRGRARTHVPTEGGPYFWHWPNG